MAIYHDPDAANRERDEYLEEIERQDQQVEKQRQHDLKMKRLAVVGEGRYKTIETVLVKCALIMPYVVCILAVAVLQMFGRPVPMSLESFLEN